MISRIKIPRLLGFFTSFSFLVFALAFVLSPTVRGEIATYSEMNQVCLNWLAKTVYTRGTWAGEANPTIADVHEIKSGDVLLARCYLINPRGYVVVPTLKEMPPVKLYSDESDFDILAAGGINQLIKDVLESKFELYVNKFGSLENNGPQLDGKPFAQTCHDEWERLSVSSETFNTSLTAKNSAAPQDYGPLLTCS